VCLSGLHFSDKPAAAVRANTTQDDLQRGGAQCLKVTLHHFDGGSFFFPPPRQCCRQKGPAKQQQPFPLPPPPRSQWSIRVLPRGDRRKQNGVAMSVEERGPEFLVEEEEEEQGGWGGGVLLLRITWGEMTLLLQLWILWRRRFTTASPIDVARSTGKLCSTIYWHLVICANKFI
jgi:hypothetical protein